MSTHRASAGVRDGSAHIQKLRPAADAVDTAQQFHLEIDNQTAARFCRRCDLSQLVVRIDADGVCRRCKRRGRVGAFLFSRSQARRAKRQDNLAVALFMIFMAVVGCLVVLASPQAKADAVSFAYTAHYTEAVCETIADYPSVAGVLGIMAGIREHAGLTHEQAAEAVVMSVTEVCPQYRFVLEAFADRGRAA